MDTFHECDLCNFEASLGKKENPSVHIGSFHGVALLGVNILKDAHCSHPPSQSASQMFLKVFWHNYLMIMKHK